MRRSLFPAEFYPVFILRDYDSQDERMAEFTQEQLDEIKRIEQAFIECQKAIARHFGLDPTLAGTWEVSE